MLTDKFLLKADKQGNLEYVTLMCKRGQNRLHRTRENTD